jgi:hypothetical protein
VKGKRKGRRSLGGNLFFFIIQNPLNMGELKKCIG